MAVHSITNANTTTNEFTLGGVNVVLRFPIGSTAFVSGSTGNDGYYTVANGVFSGGDTIITVNEPVPSSVADGTIEDGTYDIDYSDASLKSPFVIVPFQLDTTTTSLTLPGRQRGKYGEAINENMVKLMENFAGNSSPSNPTRGQLWYDVSGTSDLLRAYNGSTWESVAPDPNLIINGTSKVEIPSTNGDISVDVNGSTVITVESTKTSFVNTSIELTSSGTGDSSINVGQGRLGNGSSFIDLIGDAIYTDYGLRIIRENSGPNANSVLIHRGTGQFVVQGTETDTAMRLTTDNFSAYNGSGDFFVATPTSTDVKPFDLTLGSGDQVTRGNSGSSRALTKEVGSILVLNYAGDFTGGTAVQSKLGVNTTTVTNTLTVDDAAGPDTVTALITKQGTTNGTALLSRLSRGDNSYGVAGEFRVEGGPGTDRPSILFSHGYGSNKTWMVGFGSSSDDHFRIKEDAGYRNNSWGTDRIGVEAGGGPITFTASTTRTSSNIQVNGFDFSLGSGDQVSRGNTGGSLALVKDFGAVLALNYAGNFTGGVRVDSGITANGNSTVNGSLTVTGGLSSSNFPSGTRGAYGGKYNTFAGGTVLPGGWSLVQNSTGQYTITHNLGTQSLAINLTCRDQFATPNLEHVGYRILNSNQFRVQITAPDGVTPRDQFFQFSVIRL